MGKSSGFLSFFCNHCGGHLLKEPKLNRELFVKSQIFFLTKEKSDNLFLHFASGFFEAFFKRGNLMDAQMMEMQGLSVFGTFSIAFALRSIGSILAIWLALRIANNIRNSDEENIVAKVLGTGFGVLTVMFAYYWQTAYWSLRANTANNFKAMGDNGAELSAGVQQFVNNFASADAVSAPGAIVIAFDLIVLAMIVGQIWMPKK